MERVKNSVAEGEGVMLQLMSAKGRERFYARFGFTARPNANAGPGMTMWIDGGV